MPPRRAHRDFPRFAGTTEGELREWLLGILAHNLQNLRRYFRSRKRDSRREAPPGDGSDLGPPWAHVADGGSSPSSQAIRKEEEELIRRALAALPDEDRKVIALRHDRGLSHEEVGRELGIGEEAARKRFARAVERLAAWIKGEKQKPPASTAGNGGSV